jgi:hypothetical protein
MQFSLSLQQIVPVAHHYLLFASQSANAALSAHYLLEEPRVRRLSRMLIENGGAFVESPCAPRIAELEQVVIEAWTRHSQCRIRSHGEREADAGYSLAIVSRASNVNRSGDEPLAP